MSLLALYFLFAKYGLLCFGGGYVLVPLFIHDLVETRQLLAPEMFANLVAIAQMTPGPIGINTATFVGFTQRGVLGAIVGTLGLVSPALVLVTFAVFYFKRFEKSWFVQGLLCGMRPATLGLIYAAVAIFMEIAIFRGHLPWEMLREALTFGAIPSGENASTGMPGIRYGAILLTLLSGGLLWHGKLNIFYIIIGSALLGTLLCQ